MSDDLDGYRPLRLRPWDNLFRQIDPAEQVRTCRECGEDYEPGVRDCACYEKRSA